MNDVSLNPGPAGILPRTKGLRLFHLNICSIRNKLDELRLFCDEHKPHVLSLNETWLNNSILDSELAIPGYNIIRQDRDRFGEGLAVYVAEQLTYKRFDIFTSHDMEIDRHMEAIWLEVHPAKSRKLSFGFFIDHLVMIVQYLLGILNQY